MKETEEKRALLRKSMNMLGLGTYFNRYFFNDTKREGRPLMYQAHVLTLKEFISLNSEITTKDAHLVTVRPEDKDKKFDLGVLTRNRTAWYKLKNLLKKKNFDHNDWIHLVPEMKTGRGMFPNYSFLSTDYLQSANIHIVTDIRKGKGVAKMIESYVQRSRKDNVTGKLTVRDILNLTQKDLKSIQNIFPSYAKQVSNTMQGAQNRLRFYGFTEADGPLMSIQLFPENAVA